MFMVVVSGWWIVDDFGFLFRLSCISYHEQALHFHSLKGNQKCKNLNVLKSLKNQMLTEHFVE